MDAKHLYNYIIVPVLDQLELYSLSAARLLLGTAMVESDLRLIRQIRGPALGLFQMEPNTHDDIWEHWLRYRRGLAAQVQEFAGRWPPKTGPALDVLGGDHAPGAPTLVGNLNYAAAMCRIHYRRVLAPLPDPESAQELADYHKEWYNTWQGKTDVTKSVHDFAEAIELTREEKE